MKIFVLLPRIPWPLEKGDKLRAFNQIKQLAKNNEVILCALNDKKVNKEDAFKALQPYCTSVNFIDLGKVSILFNLAMAFFKGIPIQCGYFYNKRAHKKISKLIEKHQPDMLFGQLLRVAEYIRKEKTAKTIDYQDVFSKKHQNRSVFLIFFIFLCGDTTFASSKIKRLMLFYNSFQVLTIISNCSNAYGMHKKSSRLIVLCDYVPNKMGEPSSPKLIKNRTFSLLQRAT